MFLVTALSSSSSPPPSPAATTTGGGAEPSPSVRRNAAGDSETSSLPIVLPSVDTGRSSSAAAAASSQTLPTTTAAGGADERRRTTEPRLQQRQRRRESGDRNDNDSSNGDDDLATKGPPQIRHAGRAHVRGKIRRIWRPRYLELWDNGLVRYYELPAAADCGHVLDSDVNHVNMIARYTLKIFPGARVLDVTTLRDMHTGLPRGTFGFCFKGQRLQHLEDVNVEQPEGGGLGGGDGVVGGAFGGVVGGVMMAGLGVSVGSVVVVGGGGSGSAAAGSPTGLPQLAQCRHDVVKEPRDLLCAVSSLEEAQMWVYALQWAADSKRPIPYEPWWKPETAETAATATSPPAAASAARSTGSRTVSSRVVVTRVSNYRPVRLSAWRWEIAYEIRANKLLTTTGASSGAVGGRSHGHRHHRVSEQWVLWRVASDFERLIRQLSRQQQRQQHEGSDAAGAAGAGADFASSCARQVRRLPRLADRPSAEELQSSCAVVDSLLRSLVVDASTVNCAALKDFLGLSSSSSSSSSSAVAASGSGWLWGLLDRHDPRATHDRRTYTIPPSVSTDEYVKQWLSLSSPSSASASSRRQRGARGNKGDDDGDTKSGDRSKSGSSSDGRRLLRKKLVLAAVQRPWLIGIGVACTAAAVAPAWRMLHNHMPSVTLRLDYLVVSWIGAAWAGQYYYHHAAAAASHQQQQQRHRYQPPPPSQPPSSRRKTTASARAGRSHHQHHRAETRRAHPVDTGGSRGGEASVVAAHGEGNNNSSSYASSSSDGDSAKKGPRRPPPREQRGGSLCTTNSQDSSSAVMVHHGDEHDNDDEEDYDDADKVLRVASSSVVGMIVDDDESDYGDSKDEEEPDDVDDDDGGGGGRVDDGEKSRRLSSPLPEYDPTAAAACEGDAAPRAEPQSSCWSRPSSDIFHVRGESYFSDRVKVPSAGAPLKCRGVDVWLTDSPVRHIARHPAVLGGKLAEKDTFLVNFLLPFGNFCSYFEIPPLSEFPPKLAEVWTRFLRGDQQHRDARLKLLPVVLEGPWIVKVAVGNGRSPALLGKVIPLQYFFKGAEERTGEDDGFDDDGKKKKKKSSSSSACYEVDVIITASTIATGILNVVKGHTSQIDIAFAFIVEAARPEELPETILCSFGVHRLLLSECPVLPAWDEGGEEEDRSLR